MLTRGLLTGYSWVTHGLLAGRGWLGDTHVRMGGGESEGEELGVTRGVLRAYSGVAPARERGVSRLGVLAGRSGVTLGVLLTYSGRAPDLLKVYS